MNYKEAEKLAHRLSLENPDECFYVNWIEGYEYCVDNEPELDDQPYYLNGKMYCNMDDVDSQEYKLGEDDDYNF